MGYRIMRNRSNLTNIDFDVRNRFAFRILSIDSIHVKKNYFTMRVC